MGWLSCALVSTVDSVAVVQVLASLRLLHRMYNIDFYIRTSYCNQSAIGD